MKLFVHLFQLRCHIFTMMQNYSRKTLQVLLFVSIQCRQPVIKTTSMQNHMHEDILVQFGHVPSLDQWSHCLQRLCKFNCDVSICSCIEGVLVPSVMLQTPASVKAGYIILPS